MTTPTRRLSSSPTPRPAAVSQPIRTPALSARHSPAMLPTKESSPSCIWGKGTRLKLSARKLIETAAYAGSKIINFKLPMDSAEQLQRIYLAGFELQTFDRYPKCIGVVRDNFVALLIPGADGLQVLGAPGWRMGEVMGVLTEREGRQVFQAKSEIVEATAERLEALQRFREDLMKLLHSPA